MNSQDDSLCIFIRNFYGNITGITGELRDITVGHPTISEDCNNIIQLSEEAAFIDLNQASFYKKIANIAIHILYISPLYQSLISTTKHLSLLLEQITYKTNSTLQYQLCPGDL